MITVRRLLKPSLEILIGNLHTFTIVVYYTTKSTNFIDVASTLFKLFQRLIPTGQDDKSTRADTYITDTVGMTMQLMVEYSTVHLSFS